MEDALGYSMRENERTMETYSQRVRQLRAANVFPVVRSAGILDAQELAEVGTLTLKSSTSSPNPYKRPWSAAMFITTLGLENLALKTFSRPLGAGDDGLTKAQIGFLSAGSQLGALSLLANPFIAGEYCWWRSYIFRRQGSNRVQPVFQRTARRAKLISRNSALKAMWKAQPCSRENVRASTGDRP